MVRRIRELYRLLSARARAGLALTAVLLVVERLILAAGAFGLAGRLAITFAASAGVVVLWALRGLVRQGVVKEAREKLTMLIAEAALERGADGAFLQGEEADAAVFEGRSAAEQVIVRHLPPLLAEPIAGVVLLVVVKPAGVPVLAAVGAVAVAAILLAWLRNATVARQRSAWRKYMVVARDTLTSIRAAPELIASGHEGEYLARLRASVGEWTASAARAERNAALFQRIPLAAIVVVLAVLIVQTQRLELGQLLRLGVFFPPIAGLMRTVFELLRTAPRVHALDAALDAHERPKTRNPGKAPPPMPCEIRFENVSFSYGQSAVLKDVSFVAKPGDVLGVKGPNGSGKSTLLKLMLGLAQPSDGRILVGGLDLRELDLPAWRRGIAYLPQRPYVPEKATVMEAMRLTAPALTEGEARRALEEVGVWERMARGAGARNGGMEPLHLPVATLSVGVRQRAILARVFAQPAPLVLLDEPDENLDVEAQRLLNDIVSTRARRAGHLVVVVSHAATLLAAARAPLELPLQPNGASEVR